MGRWYRRSGNLPPANGGRTRVEEVYAGVVSGGNLKLAWTTKHALDGQRTELDFDGTGSGQADDNLDFTYDTAGRPDLIVDDDTVDVTLTDYAWNPDGTLLSRVDAGISGSSSFSYDWAGRLTSYTLPTGFSGSVSQS
jgi:hypothetical protein